MAQQYTVKSGDTLSKIASNFGVDLGSISGYRSGNPNLIYPGEVLNVSSANTSINANQMKPAASVPLPTQQSNNSKGTSSLFSGDSVQGQVDKYRKELEKSINSRKKEVDSQLKDLREKEKTTLGNIQEVTTPFREDLENTERERLYVNKNFEENQKLVDELDTLLTEGNNLIRQQQEITGLAAVRNPRVQRAMDDVAARAGVIEAVINARNGQISVAENMIDRSVSAIAADRQDQLYYYKTVLDLNRQDLLALDDESKKLADYQVSLIENDLNRAQETADYVKKLMVDPNTAAIMGEAGVSLNDSVDQIKSKITVAQHNRELREFSNEISLSGGVAVLDPSTVPANQLITYTDGNGNTHYYKMPPKASGDGSGSIIGAEDPSVQAWVGAIQRGAASINDVPSALRTSVAAALGGAGSNDLSFEQYLQAAQETASMSFTPKLIEELRTQYNSFVSSSGLSSGGHSSDDWANAIELGYASISAVPENLRAEVVKKLNR